MGNKPNQKLKLLYLWKILMEATDDVNGVTTQQIIEKLAEQGIDAERKGIYRDMDALREFGLKVEQRGGKHWYLATRPLELQEMILLVDALQSTPFLTEAMTDHLIERIRSFASVDQRKMLQRRIEVPGRIKMDNEAIFKNLDVIQQAMRRKRKVSFSYFHYDMNKKKVLNKDGATYQVTPVRLIYADELYYLISFMDKWADVEGHQPFTPFRVDRMTDVRVNEEPATRDERIATYVTEEHISPAFGIYASEKVPVVLEFDPSAMNPIIDKFGLDAAVFEKEDGRARAYVKAPLSPQFYGWLLQLGPAVKIVSPKRAADEFARMLDRALLMYRSRYRILSEKTLGRFRQEEFLELLERLKAALEEKVAKQPQGGFETEAAFIDFSWDVIEKWRVERCIDDGMPDKLPEKILVDGKRKTIFHPIHLEAYKAFGQIAGEAMLAVEPRRWAAPEARGSFLDADARYGEGRPFEFEATLAWKPRDWQDGETGGRRYRAEKGGCAFEAWHVRDEEGFRCRFTSDAEGFGPVDIKPWLGGRTLPDARNAAAKYWQKIAYRFS